MSSHREAPEISKDPVADSTDLYAFVSPDHRHGDPDRNYVPLESPDGGPNFYEFGDDVLYEIPSTTTATATPTSATSSVQQRDPQSQHLSLQHRADSRTDRQELNRRHPTR